MNVLQRASRRLIKLSFHTSVKIIEYFSAMDKYRSKVEALRNLPEGSLGKEVATCLDRHQLTLVPKYESHDLKHVLLDYKMTAEDEIRLQAFMIGNGNYSIASFAIFLFGALLLPDLWPVFYQDFQQGRRTVPISHWTLEEYAGQSLKELRFSLQNQTVPTQNVFTMKRFTQFAAVSTVLAGVFGMLFCLPFLFSAHLEDLVGAGFPFVGGAILVVGGLLTLSNLAKEPRPLKAVAA